VVKYRGSAHGTNEYPFMIDSGGLSVLPITSMGLDHVASTERVSSGVPALDDMLGGKGFFRGTSVLVTGTAGTGKTTLAGHFAQAACARGQTCLYFAFEESRDQIVRNLKSVGLDLQKWIDNGSLHLQASRPTIHGLEMHLALMHKQIEQLKPQTVIVDPVSNFISVGSSEDVLSMMMRLVDHLKSKQITAYFTHLNSGGKSLETTDMGISSVIDTWLLLRDIESDGERNRAIYILKSRGMAHSNNVREFIMTDQGVKLVDVYRGPSGVLVGSARSDQERRSSLEAAAKTSMRDRKRRDLEAKIQSLRSELDAIDGYDVSSPASSESDNGTGPGKMTQTGA